MKIVVGITGASGSIYADRFIKALSLISDRLEDIEIIFSKTSILVWNEELLHPIPKLNAPFRIFENNNFYAPAASGSALIDAMVIIPCSMGMLSRVAHGISNDLISRAADVMLKERRKLILVPRETPYSSIHLKNMLFLTEAGAIIVPASPSFYKRPSNIDELVDTVIDRLFDLLGLDKPTQRWGS